MESIKDASHHYGVERRALHAERPGFRISELQIGPTQSVPWTSTARFKIRSTSSRARSGSFSVTRSRRCGSAEVRPMRCVRAGRIWDQRRGGISDLPRAAGHRRVRLRAAGVGGRCAWSGDRGYQNPSRANQQRSVCHRRGFGCSVF